MHYVSSIESEFFNPLSNSSYTSHHIWSRDTPY